MKFSDKQPPPEIVDDILRQALSEGASDIYLLPERDRVRVVFRVNGLQLDVTELAVEPGIQCITRVKVLAGLLTYRTEIAQDGVIRNHVACPNAELRVAVMPSIYGERITIRLRDAARGLHYLEDLGFQEETMENIRANLLRPHGMIILTGPTGCGKTTTIYAMVRELLRQDQDPASIISLEDPVECEIPGITQVSVSRRSDEWGYSQALRAALRQDVKTLVIGEMRDRDVVKVALDAALTGHRVITTYHAGDIPEVYARLLHLGFESFLVSAAITGVAAQRLVKSQMDESQLPIAAFLEPDDPWRDFIIDNPGLTRLREKVKDYPGACLKAVARKLADEQVITEKDVHLL